jgi:hypothetical protein
MLEKSIEEYCIELCLKNYKIDENNIVNVNGDVILRNRNLYKIPIQFGIVTNVFTCSLNGLKSLKGAPYTVRGSFYCSDNQLTSLEGCPIEVGGYFDCCYNKLISLEGGPIKIGGKFNCYGNPIHDEYSEKYGSYKHYMRTIKLKKLLFST